MKYKLIKPVNPNYSAIEQILTNRGIKLENIPTYLNTTDEVINKPETFGLERMREGAKMLSNALDENKSTLIIVDSDCDGYTSSALLINYLYKISPAFVENKVDYFMHSGKQHGLNDCIDVAMKYQFVICPDSSSNDFEYHKQLKENGIDVLVLDHHEAERVSENACIINNQLSDYPNKELSGVGVTWQFCRFLDELLNKDYADEYLDLVALGNMADMMSLRSIETKHLINKGFEPERVKNPFIFEMWQKNKFKLKEHITPMGAAFYIAPFVNAMVRSGTEDEKELLFKSMLNHKAFEQILSNKRGHKVGETERVVDQAIRTCTNVKNRQTKAQDNGLAFLEKQIKDKNLLDNKVLLFTLEPGQVDRNIAGLIANKFMAKYQRPCCILTKVVEMTGGDIIPLNNGDTEVKYEPTEMKVSYQGSARGYDRSGITNFKDICAGFDETLFAEGHQGAFGLGLPAAEIDNFLNYTNEELKDMSSEPVYHVDYIYNKNNIDKFQILEMANLASLWGKDMDESFIAVENLQITKDMVTLMSADKNPTLKIKIAEGIEALKFGSSQEEYEKFLSDGYVKVNIVGRCNINKYYDKVTAQIMIEDVEITGRCKYLF